MSLNAREIYQEPEIKEVKKLKDGTVKLPVTHATSMGVVDFDFRLSKNKEGRLIITNATKITEKNKGYVKNVDKAYFLDASSPEAFAKSLGKALNEYIGEGRRSLDPEKRQKAYEFLGYKKQLEIATIKADTLSQLNVLKRSINPDKLPDDFLWNEEIRTLSVSYHIGYGKDEKIIYLNLKDTGAGKVEVSFKHGFLWSIAELDEEKKSFSRATLESDLQNYVEGKMGAPLRYKTFF